jgi:hypothetical protein
MVPEPPSEAGTKFTQSAPTDGVLLSDVAGVATGTNTLANEKASKKTIGKQGKVTEPDSAYGAEYPNNKTITTKSGHVIELDDTEGKERIHIYHKSGTYVEINETGKIVFKSVDDRYDIVDANAKILVTGNVTMEVDGNVDETIMGNRTTTILGSDTTIVTGKIYRKSSASIKDEAPRIDHN